MHLLPVRAARACRPVAALLDRALGLHTRKRLHDAASGGTDDLPLWDRALDALRISIEPRAGDLSRIPATGPLLVVANHPLGLADGLALLQLLHRARGDVKVIATRLLRLISPLEPVLLPVNLFGGKNAVHRNAVVLRSAIRWLRSGGCVVVFPAGEVAHRGNGAGGTIESAWHRAAAAIAAHAPSAVLPVHIDGANSRAFRLAGRVSPWLRTALLPRELCRLRGRTVHVRVGHAIPPLLLRNIDPADRTLFLRTATLALGGIRQADRATSWRRGASRNRALDPEPIAPPVARRLLTANVAALAPEERLLSHNEFDVFCAARDRLEDVVQEIGRLRELAFREVGEGSGRSRDLDRFDDTYLHLFVWHRLNGEIVGAYRVACTDNLPRGAGVHGLYTRTLFEYGDRLLAEIGPALELGRSFVTPEHQRRFSPLLLLWRGICRIVARAPRYRRLFGAVSISSRYDSMSRRLLMEFLRAHRYDPRLAALVRARHYPRTIPRDASVHSTTVATLEELSSVLRRIEPDGKDVPILVRQYLTLNARLLGFTVDPTFNDTLDGLMLVDLLDVDRKLLARYMGRHELHSFLAHHQAVETLAERRQALA